MLQSFECPNCQATLDYDAQTESLTVRCNYCSSTVIVPDSLRKRRGQTSQQTQILAEIVQLVQNGRKIEAIKQFREAFNVGLKEAKDVIDAIERHEDIHLGGTSFHTEAVQVSTYTTTPTVKITGGRTGCIVGVALLVIGVIIAAGFFIAIPATTIGTAAIVEGISSAAESNLETSSETILEEATPEPQFAEVVLQFGGEEGIGPGFFNDTRRLAVDGKGNIYTGDYSGGRIQVFDAEGNFIATWNAGDDLLMSSMTVDRSGTMYILLVKGVEKYDGMTGVFLGTVMLPDSQSTRFETAGTGPDGSIYLVGDNRLVRLDSNDNVTLDITDPFTNIPDFATTNEDVTVDGAGNIYVLGRETIYKLNSQGQFIDQIGSKGEADDQFFTSPTSLAVDGQGRIFVYDFNGIKVFEGNGRYLATIESPGVAFDMTITDENDLFVMDRNGNEVRKYRLNQ